MQIGVNYPQAEIETDAGAIKEFAQGVQAMGFTHVNTAEHVVGANPASRPGQNLPFSLESSFHEPFGLFSFMAAVTNSLGFVNGILVLPQRQTVLVAKQAACLDVFCGGRYRLGIGIGWNEDEYEALGAPYGGRGNRIEEQVEVLRALWTDEAVSFKGTYHTITDMGINPRPIQRPIPIWFGGGTDRPTFGKTASETVMRRIARLGDGWIPQLMANDRGLELLAKMRGLVAEYGRDPSTFGVEGRVDVSRANEELWAPQVEVWKTANISHLYVNTSRDGLVGVDQHLVRLEEFCTAVAPGGASELRAG